MSNSQELIQELLNAFAHLYDTETKKPLYVSTSTNDENQQGIANQENKPDASNIKAKDNTTIQRGSAKKGSTDGSSYPVVISPKSDNIKLTVPSSKVSYTTPEINFNDLAKKPNSLNPGNNDSSNPKNVLGQRTLSITFQKMDSNVTNRKKSVSDNDTITKINYLVTHSLSKFILLECQDC